VKSTYIA